LWTNSHCPWRNGWQFALLHRRAGRRADVREEQRRLDAGREVAQVDVTPRGGDAAIATGPTAVGPVPAQPEAVAVGRLDAHPGVQALVDQAVVGLEEQLVDSHRLTEERIPAAHARQVGRTCAPSGSC
jgi:hypothetical protein